jgi:hypothetical protein
MVNPPGRYEIPLKEARTAQLKGYWICPKLTAAAVDLIARTPAELDLVELARAKDLFEARPVPEE